MPRDSDALPHVLSLFSGAGGLDWGFRQEGFPIALALDISWAAVDTHEANFSGSCAVSVDLMNIGARGVASLLITRVPSGSRIGVIGGPPCQGFSRANTTAETDDPRNLLAQLYVDVVSELRKRYDVEFVIFENVLGIRDTKHVDTYSIIKKRLKRLRLAVTEHELCALDFGVPQNRKRIVVAGLRSDRNYREFRPYRRKGVSTVREAIEGLPSPAFYTRNLDQRQIPVHPNHWTMMPKSERFKKPLNGVADGRSFKLLEWDKASPTVAYGHREIHIHPTGKRRLSVYEAMRLQGFPETFVLKGNFSEQVEQVSNAVPPPLAKSLAAAIRRSLKGS